MIRRLQNLHENNSFFLFGARGTGKTTLLEQHFSKKDALWIDLLTDADEERYGRHPDELIRVLATKKYRRVVIDEVQKAPKILDVIHHEMEKNKAIQFILTGSSARKLKRGASNLLAGRAFTYHLFPLVHAELGEAFHLRDALTFGTLPKLLEYSAPEEKNDFLRAYVKNYLREEIQIEQLIRQLNPFRNFLEIAAQGNGTIINFSRIAREAGIDDKTVANYFSILEDTLIGVLLPPFHRSVRKQQRESPKFYFFDTGVVRALAGTLRVELLPQTFAFGNAFEHWVILECFRFNEYKKLDYKFSYLMTKDNAEIDLIIQRPGETDLLVEIKSTHRVMGEHLYSLKRFQKDWDCTCEAQVWSLDPLEKNIDGVVCLYWQTAMQKYFGV
ncbi:MAG: ATP-binding protein [Chlamydiae bacterium]|nr:ATP-binding protein [Chlamydiota bacterium]MBI3266886.1 ATP-binding protein [Chlamydiota bacterium]